jgi:hypothetical protein
MYQYLKISAFFAVAFCLFGCGDSSDRAERFHEFVDHDNRTARNKDQSNGVIIVKHGGFTPWQEVGVIFGFVDNMAACKEILSAFNSKDPRPDYGCHTVEEINQIK